MSITSSLNGLENEMNPGLDSHRSIDDYDESYDESYDEVDNALSLNTNYSDNNNIFIDNDTIIRNVIDVSVQILAKHIESSKKKKVLISAIKVINEHLNKTKAKSNSIFNIFGDINLGSIGSIGRVRRSTISLEEKDSTDDSNKSDDIYSVDVIPKYTEKPNDISIRPDSFETKFNINGIGMTNEINLLNDAILKQKDNIDILAQQVTTATDFLNTGSTGNSN